MASEAPPQPPTDISTRAEFDAAVLWSLQAAQARQARRLWLVDPDFDDWPLDRPDVMAVLQAWVQLPLRRLVLVGGRFDAVPRMHPRFTEWRRDWAHAVEAWSPSEQTLELPRLVLDDGPVCLQRFEGAAVRGRASLDARAARRWREDLDAVLQQSQTAFPVHTLGL